MRKFLAILGISVSTFILACSKTDASANIAKTTTATPNPHVSPAPAAPQDDAPRISLADAKKNFDEGNVVFIDTRADTVYREEHIKGAINITIETLEKQIKSLPKNKTLIAYCSWPNEHTSASLVSAMQKKGIKNAYALLGGTMAWKNAGYPMESTK